MGKTKIEWTEFSWNPLRVKSIDGKPNISQSGNFGTGCTMVSPGCQHCYAGTINKRFYGNDYSYHSKPTEFFLDERIMGLPVRRKKPTTFFVGSMTDIFHSLVTDNLLDLIFAVMAQSKQHTFQVLTKRPDRMRAYCSDPKTPQRVDRLKHVIEAGRIAELFAPERITNIFGWPGYFVTSKGRVLSDRTRAGARSPDELHELKPQPGAQGHMRVELQVDGTKDRQLVHRLVLSHFDRRAVDNEQGCHIDGDSSNNALWNLRWGNQLANWADSKRHGTRRRYTKLTMRDITKIKARLVEGESAYTIAPDFGVSDTQIRNIANGKQWQPEYQPEWPLQSVWLGVSAENQEMADFRIAILLNIPAAVRWVSFEPLLGAIRGVAGIDWAVVGGESGPKARPMHPDWARSLRDQCLELGIPFFFKQWGTWGCVDYFGDDPDEKGRSCFALPTGIITDTNWNNGPGPHLKGGQRMWRFGKKLAGRVLDHAEWNQMPAHGESYK